jgi:hypothetical protein
MAFSVPYSVVDVAAAEENRNLKLTFSTLSVRMSNDHSCLLKYMITFLSSLPAVACLETSSCPMFTTNAFSPRLDPSTVNDHAYRDANLPSTST